MRITICKKYFYHEANCYTNILWLLAPRVRVEKDACPRGQITGHSWYSTNHFITLMYSRLRAPGLSTQNAYYLISPSRVTI